VVPPDEALDDETPLDVPPVLEPVETPPLAIREMSRP